MDSDSDTRPARRWPARITLSAFALLGGIGLAEMRASAAERTKPLAPPVLTHQAPAAAPLRSVGAARLPRVEPFQVPDRGAPHSGELTGLGRAFAGGRIITGATPHRLILFTFDDGPDRRTTPLLLDRLDAAGMRAVFFLVASRFAGNTPTERLHAGIAREIVRRGHLIGHHTLDHAQLPLLDDEGVRHQITSAEEIFTRVLGGRPFLFRPPFGAHSPRTNQLLAQRDYTTLLWNLGSGDFQVRSADEVFDTWLKVFERREQEEGDRGGVILLHDTYAWSVDAFERIVSHLQSRNCELLEAGEELYDFVDDPSFFFVPRAGASPDELAPPAKLDPVALAARQAALRETERLRCAAVGSAH